VFEWDKCDKFWFEWEMFGFYVSDYLFFGIEYVFSSVGDYECVLGVS